MSDSLFDIQLKDLYETDTLEKIKTFITKAKESSNELKLKKGESIVEIEEYNPEIRIESNKNFSNDISLDLHLRKLYTFIPWHNLKRFKVLHTVLCKNWLPILGRVRFLKSYKIKSIKRGLHRSRNSCTQVHMDVYLGLFDVHATASSIDVQRNFDKNLIVDSQLPQEESTGEKLIQEID